MFVDRSLNFLVILHVQFWPSLNQCDVRALHLRVFYRGPGFHAVRFGFVAGGQAAGGIGIYCHDAHRTPSKLRAVLLFDGGEVGVEVKKKPAYAGVLAVRVGWKGETHSGNEDIIKANKKRKQKLLLKIA